MHTPWKIRGSISPASYWTLAAVGLIVPLAVWTLLSVFGAVNQVFLPSPYDVAHRFAVWFSDGDLLTDVRISFFRIVAGWALSALVAMPIGLAIGTFPGVQALLEPLTDFVRYMPAVAFIPLVMLWVGIDESAKVAIIFIGTFFQMVLMVVRITMGWAWTYLVVAELVAADSGLGYAIIKAQRFLQTDRIFAGIILIGAIGLAIDQCFRWVHRVTFPWLRARD